MVSRVLEFTDHASFASFRRCTESGLSHVTCHNVVTTLSQRCNNQSLRFRFFWTRHDCPSNQFYSNILNHKATKLVKLLQFVAFGLVCNAFVSYCCSIAVALARWTRELIWCSQGEPRSEAGDGDGRIHGISWLSRLSTRHTLGTLPKLPEINRA